jgi:hypothetical protein
VIKTTLLPLSSDTNYAVCDAWAKELPNASALSRNTFSDAIDTRLTASTYVD